MTSMTLHLSRTYSADVLCVRMYVGAFVVKKNSTQITRPRTLLFFNPYIYIYIYIINNVERNKCLVIFPDVDSVRLYFY